MKYWILKNKILTTKGWYRKKKYDFENGAQICILAYKIATNDDPILSLRSPNKLYITIIFVFSLLCSCYVVDLIKNCNCV